MTRVWDNVWRGAALCMGLVMANTSATAQETQLDGIVITTSKVIQSAIDTLSSSSSIDDETINQQYQPERISEVVNTMPGVTTQETGRDTATAINIRGLQDFGRVNVLIDGARQNFQRSGHAANGVFYAEPEMFKRVEITRGPTATIYGSGAIGGVAAFELLTADDILEESEYAAARIRTTYGTNGNSWLGSGTAAMKVDNFDLIAQYNGRSSDDYDDGSGDRVLGTNDDTRSGFAKARFRPAAGHEVSFAAIDYHSEFLDETEPAQGSIQRETEVSNNQFTLGYTFKSQDNDFWDLSAKGYFNRTKLSQTRVAGSAGAPFFTFLANVGGAPSPFALPPPPGGYALPGPGGTCPPPAPCYLFNLGAPTPAGAPRLFSIETRGFDVFNTSRFAWSNSNLALTYGVDGFEDRVENFDPFGNGDELTPSGKREVYGGFVQAHFTFFDFVDVIAALRYDDYSLEGNGVSLDDDHVSPKVTVGVTPVKGFQVYGTFAEGFRAPAVTETLISGSHPPPADFALVPNPNLRPEVAQTYEVGVNIKYNDVLQTGDAFRAKVAAFRNDVEDFIELFSPDPVQGFLYGVTGGPFGGGFGAPTPLTPFGPTEIFTGLPNQYQNVANAVIRGVELEMSYDAGSWFAGVSGHIIRGKNEDTGLGLRSIPADQLVLTLGFRALDEKLTAGGRVRFVGDQDRFDGDPPGTPGTTVINTFAEAYTTLDLFAEYRATDNATFNVVLNNITDEDYRQHLNQDESPGFNARLGMTMRFGAN